VANGAFAPILKRRISWETNNQSHSLSWFPRRVLRTKNKATVYRKKQIYNTKESQKRMESANAKTGGWDSFRVRALGEKGDTVI